MRQAPVTAPPVAGRGVRQLHGQGKMMDTASRWGGRSARAHVSREPSPPAPGLPPPTAGRIPVASRKSTAAESPLARWARRHVTATDTSSPRPIRLWASNRELCAASVCCPFDCARSTTVDSPVPSHLTSPAQVPPVRMAQRARPAIPPGRCRSVRAAVSRRAPGSTRRRACCVDAGTTMPSHRSEACLGDRHAASIRRPPGVPPGTRLWGEGGHCLAVGWPLREGEP